MGGVTAKVSDLNVIIKVQNLKHIYAARPSIRPSGPTARPASADA